MKCLFIVKKELKSIHAIVKHMKKFFFRNKDFIKKMKKNNSQNKILKDSHYIMKIISNCYKSHKSNKRYICENELFYIC